MGAIARHIFSRRGAVSLAVAAASGAIMLSAYPPFGRRAAVLFALAPLLALVRLGASPRRAAWTFFAAGMVYWPATLSWFPAIIPNGGPWPLVAAGQIGLSALCSAYFALFGWFDARLWNALGDAPSPARLAGVAGEAVLWAGFECLRANLFTGFAWNFLAVPLGVFPAVAGFARFGGVYGVSALVVLVNGAIASIAARTLRPMTALGPDPRTVAARIWRSAESWLAIAVVACAVLAGAPERKEGFPLTATLLQRNFPCIFRRAADRSNGMRVYTELVKEATDESGRKIPAGSAFTEDAPAEGRYIRPDVLLMPESALSEFGRRGLEFAVQLGRFAGGAAVIAGCDTTDDGKIRNSAVLLKEGSAPGLYHKQHLVPFGEYIPLDKTFTWLQRFSPVGASLWPGESAIFEIDAGVAPGGRRRTVKAAPLICFEDTDPSLSRKAAAAGAQAIMLVTNDNWFYGSVEPIQHFEQSVYRAIETGLPVLRTGNSGVTGAIMPDGSRRTLDGPDGRPLCDAAGAMTTTVEVEENPAPTVYVRFGDWPLLALFAAAIVLPAFRRRRA